MPVIFWIGPEDPDPGLFEDREPPLRVIRSEDHPRTPLQDHLAEPPALVGIDARRRPELLEAFEAARDRYPCPTLILSGRDLSSQDLDQPGILVRSGPDAAARSWIAMALEAHRSHARLAHFERQSRRQDSLVQKLVHDMKSPLTVMLMDLGMLERWWEKRRSDRFLSSVERLTQCCEDLTEMIQNLLDANRLQSGALEMQPCNIGLGAILREQFDAPPALLEKKGVELRLDLRDTETTVRVDPVLLGRALQNLLRTASVLCESGGRIGLKVRRDQGRMFCGMTFRGAEAQPEVVDALLDPFAHDEWRTLGLDAGAGIGLNLSRLLVEAHSGRLSLDQPTAGDWSFEMRLPVAQVQL